MPILVTCDCGTKLRAKDEQAGKKIRCPSCKEVMLVPTSTSSAVSSSRRDPAEDEERPASRKLRYPDREDSEDAGDEDEKPRKKRKSSDKVQPTPQSSRYEVDEDEDEDRSRRRKRRDEEDEDEDRPREKRRSRKDLQLKTNLNDKYLKKTGNPPQGNAFNAGVFGGLAMMIIAVVWFVGGLMADILFYYPPVLFIIGLVATIKGAVDGNLTGKR